MPTYKVIQNKDSVNIIVQTNEDGTVWSFLEDEANPHYQEYFQWKTSNGSEK